MLTWCPFMSQVVSRLSSIFYEKVKYVMAILSILLN